MKKNKKPIIILAACIVIILVLFLLSIGKEVFIKIPDGSTPRQIARLLKENKIIISERLFLGIVRLTGTDKKLKPGTYKFSTGQTSLTVLRDIALGNTHKIKITIPEGFSANEISELLERKGVCSAREFIEIVKKRKLEGYLFPETYFFEPETAPDEVVLAITKQFDKKFTQTFLERAKQLKMTKEKVVILASIIEKEAKQDKERPLISAVFHNRLKKDWYLESCATVLYALGKHKEVVTYKDLKVNSPFNTYIHPGLPPAPICNPGLASIKAALYPADSPDMFFVADGSGTHMFSQYATEHIKNKQLIKKSKNSK